MPEARHRIAGAESDSHKLGATPTEVGARQKTNMAATGGNRGAACWRAAA
ncbi:hypothetical protein GCM10010483_62880 [Actinokineospora diospyrosa]